MKKNYCVIQDGIKECGSACLLSIIRYYGGNIQINRLLELTNTTKDGTNFYDIAKAANEIGLSAKWYKLLNIDKIKETKKPFISQVIINNYKHFVVVYKLQNNKLTIMDPAKGIIKLSADKFNQIWTSYILVLEPYKKLPFYQENNYLNSVIINIIKSNKKKIIGLLSLTILLSILTIFYGYYFKVIIDSYQNKNIILVIMISFMITLIIRNLIKYLRNQLLINLNKTIDYKIITTTIEKIIYLPYSYYKNKTTGEVIARINDLFYLKNIITKAIITIFLDIILAVLILCLLLNISLSMTYLLFLIIIVYFLVFISYKPKQTKTMDEIQISNASVNSLLTETISSYETIKGLNIESIFTDKLKALYQNNLGYSFILTKTNNQSNFIKDTIEGIIVCYLIYFGIVCVLKGDISLGTMLTYNTLMYYFITPIRNCLDFYQEYYYTKNSIKRANNLLNYKYESLDQADNEVINGDIVIKKLSFNYGITKPVLKDLNMFVKARSNILITGKSGSGKSTILKLIYHYYSPQKNQIFLANKDLLDYKLKTIRRNITYISQNELLYTGTLKNNLVLGRNINEDELAKVINLTYVSEIINHHPLGINMPIEENGANLSGGERQRIILARAILKKSPIVLIDEGLSQIDPALERKILNNIFNYYQDRTFIIISHRLSNYDLYHRHYELINGRLRSINEYKGGKNGINQKRFN